MQQIPKIDPSHGIQIPYNEPQRLIEEIIQKSGIVLDTTQVSLHTYTSSLLYLVYWYHRTKNNPTKEKERKQDIVAYIGDHTSDDFVGNILSDETLALAANEYVKNTIKPVPTIDLVITRTSQAGIEQVLTLDREYFPTGRALPGGLIQEEDESNEYGISGPIYTALRITAEKVFHTYSNIEYGVADQDGSKYYFVKSMNTSLGNSFEARIYFNQTTSYRYIDRLNQITSPSDPRHMVDSTAFKVDIIQGDISDFSWIDTTECTQGTSDGKKGMALSHHQTMVAHVIAQNKAIPEPGMSHHEWIRSAIAHPQDMYTGLRDRFAQNHNNPETSVPELLPVINQIRDDLVSDTISELIIKNPSIGIMKEQLFHKLNHITIQNGLFCPYASSLRVIFECIAFFDTCRRSEKHFSTHFQKKYWHRYHQLMSKIPDIFVIPTTENISATDLMRMREVPVYLVGVTPDPTYVDEFWQSPLEFLIHDLNHSWKMMDADTKYVDKHGIGDMKTLYERSSVFASKYLDSIKILKNDSKEVREMKKLKKIILFEIVHEDARPFLPEVIAGALLESEGYPIQDDTIEYVEGNAVRVEFSLKGITALSYVRHKLQHGFFDQTDSQNIAIVGPEYRSVDHIVRAAIEILAELDTKIPQSILDEGLSKFLTRQATSRGPDLIHAPERLDPAVKENGDGTYV